MMQSDLFLLVLWEAFYLLGYLAVFIFLGRTLHSRRIFGGMTAGGLLIYLCNIGFTALLYQYFGCDAMVFYLIHVCYSLGLAVWLGRLIWQDRHQLDFRPFPLLALDLAALLFITLVSRLGDPLRGGVRLIPLWEILESLQSTSNYLLIHSLLNVLLFVPTGFLLALSGSERLRRIEINFLIGLVLSTAIETAQLITHLGLCDINDIICNALGAAAGAALCRFIDFQKFQNHPD